MHRISNVTLIVIKNIDPKPGKDVQNRIQNPNMDKKQAEDAIEMFKNMFRELAGGDAKVKQRRSNKYRFIVK